MHPDLRDLNGTGRSIADIAELLERHLGDGDDPQRCREALASLRRLRRQSTTYYLRIALRALDDEGSPCQIVRGVIAVLHKWRFYSGT